MKKITFKQKLLLLVLLGFLSTSFVSLNAQCIRPSQFGNVVSNNSGLLQGIVTCAYSSSEYSNVTGLIIGEDYVFTGQTGVDYGLGNHVYLTITDASNTVIQHGFSPQTLINVAVTGVRIHLSDDSTCSGTADCHNTTVTLLTSCMTPTNLVASNITTVSADLSWNEPASGVPSNGYDYYYSTTNTAPTSSTAPSGNVLTGTTVNLSSLNPATTYYYWIRSNCGSESSAWSNTSTFVTGCIEVTSFFENFDSYTTDFFSTMPICWSRGGSSTSTYITTGSVSPMSPSNRLYMFASGSAVPPTEGYAIMPAVSNLQDNTHRLKFQAFATAENRFIEIGYLTTPSDITTFVLLEEIFLPGTSAATAQEFVVTPTGIPAGVKHLAFKNPGFPSASTTVYIDNVTWEPTPACDNPTAVSSSAVTSDSAIISWNTNASAVSWEIEYGAPGFTLGTGTVVPVSAYPFTLNGLTPQTNYEYYVRSICAGSLTSSNSLPGSFTTACAPFIPDYTQNFSSFLPSCWKVAAAGNPSTGPTGTDAGIWFADGFLNSGSTGAVKVNLYFTNRVGWLISPIIDLSSGGYRVRYDVGATTWNQTTPTTMGSDDEVVFLMSTDGGSTWTALETFNSTNTPSNSSTTKVYDISAQTSATAIFAFYATDGAVDDTPDYDFFIDNFVVETPPASPPTCATNIVATPDACGNFPFEISWDATPSTLGYKIKVGTTVGGSEIANNVDLGLTTTYSYATPSINTTYYYTITPYNSVGDAVGCSEMSFTTSATGCYCLSNPTSVDGVGITNVELGTLNYPISVTSAPYYSDQTATPVVFNQGVLNNIQISFNTLIYNYDTHIYVDLNDNFTFEASELLFSGVSSSTSPNVYNASFIMPATAPIGNHRMRIVTADFMPLNDVDPCYSGSYGFTVDFTVNIQVASCSPPVATTSIVPACATNEFFIDVNVTDLGSGSPSITDGTTTTPITTIGTTQIGPYASGTSVVLNILHGTDTTCNIALGTTTYTCPPVNDDLCNATVLTLDAATTGTSYTLVGATEEQSEPVPSCFSDGINGSVWFSFVAPSSGAVNVTTDFPGGSLTDGDTEIAVYDATGVICADLTSLSPNIGCDQDGGTTVNYSSFLSLTGLTSGTTYYIQVDRYSGTTAGSFGIQVNTVLSTSSFDSSNFVVYPNPVQDFLNLSYSSEITSVKVVNLLGQVVISRNVGNNSAKIDMSALQAGAYIVNVTSGETVKSLKVIKQ